MWILLILCQVKKPSVTKGHILYDFHLYELCRVGKSIETESKLVVSWAGGREEWGTAANGYGVSLWGDEMFWNWIMVMVL